MRLSEFIQQNMETILLEWETFAATLLPAAENMTPLALRDHAQQILAAIAVDLETPQTREEQSEKSKGNAPKSPGAPETAAQTHAVLRARSGFDIVQLIAEYRALRASVLRLWLDKLPDDMSTTRDMIRFNEAIDQAVAESVGHFHGSLQQARALFLGMLGHDLRTPLTAITMTASQLSMADAGDEVAGAAARLLRSATAMQSLLDDLVDFNRTQLGLGLPLAPAEVDLAALLSDEVEQLRDANPGRAIELTVSGDCHGHCDGLRMQQVVRNLTNNALKYGFSDTPVRISLAGDPDAFRLEVANRGAAGNTVALDFVFDPLKRGFSALDGDRDRSSLGLGLFIVREIVEAHRGNLTTRSDNGETAFVICLPRRSD